MSSGLHAFSEPQLPGKVLVVGAGCFDDVYEVDHIIKPGETLQSSRYTPSIGGKGVNCAVATSRAGAETYLYTIFGHDGNSIRRLVAKNGVKTDYIAVSDDLPTGRCIVQLQKNAECCVLLTGGSSKATSFPLPSFEPFKVVITQNELAFRVQLEALHKAHEAGCVIVYNPSPWPSAEEIEQIPFHLVDWLIVNESEAADLTDGIKKLPGGIVKTLGARGAVAHLRASGKAVHSPAGLLSEKGVVDTTGAGDCFTSYFAASLLKLDDPRRPTLEQLADVLTIANQAAAISVESIGAARVMPFAQDVSDRLK